LAGDQRRGALGAVLEDLEQLVALRAGEGGEAPSVDHEQVGLGQAGEGAEVGAIATGDVQFVEEPRGAHAVGGVAGAAGALGEGLAEPRLADAGRNNDILRSFRARSSSIISGTRGSGSH